MFSPIATLNVVLLAVFGLVGGIGISSVGPGGVLPTIGLFALTGLPPAAVAGTALVTHVGTGALGSAMYLKSGELKQPSTCRTALVLSATALVGTPLGAWINILIARKLFGLILIALVVLALSLMWWRERHGINLTGRHPSLIVTAGVGLAIAVGAGIVGIGGPMLTVPVLVGLGVPILESLAAAQAQSLVVASVGTAAYVAAGAVHWSLAAVVGIPEMLGVVAGWAIAQRVPQLLLKRLLVTALLILTPWLALSH